MFLCFVGNIVYKMLELATVSLCDGVLVPLQSFFRRAERGKRILYARKFDRGKRKNKKNRRHTYLILREKKAAYMSTERNYKIFHSVEEVIASV